MRLRSHSKDHCVFREIADFVAHNDVRNKGISNTSLEAFYFSIRYLNEFISPKPNLNIFKPFPLYVKKLMKYQVEKCKESDLKTKFNVSKARLKSRIDTLFMEDKSKQTAVLKKPNISVNNIKTIQYLLSFIGGQPVFEQSSIINSILNVILDCKLIVCEDDFINQQQQITLCILLLMHNTKFSFDDGKQGYCTLSSERTELLFGVKYIDSEGNPIKDTHTFGHLQINGYVVVDNNGRDLHVSYPLVSTELDTVTWCEDNLFIIEPLSEEHSQYLFKKIKFDGDLIFSESGKVGVVNT